MTQADTQVDDELLNDEPEVVEEEVVTPEVETETPETTEDETDELEIHFEGESPTPEEEQEQNAPDWVRAVRKENREKAKRIRELEAQLSAKTQPQAVVVGAKPTLEGVEYDTDRYERELEQWHERKRSADAEERKKQDEMASTQKAWQERLDAYNSMKSEFKAKDFEEAEAETLSLLSPTQQGIILEALKNPANMVYALGKNPKKLKELSLINNPVRFTAAIAVLEKDMTIKPRKAAPLPETAVRGSGRGVSDQTLARLEAEAEKTGDRSKIAAYRAQVKKKANT